MLFFYLDLNIKLNKNICVTKSIKNLKNRKHIHNKTHTEVEKRQLQVLHFLLNYKYRGFPNNNSLPTVSLNMINRGSVRYLGL